MKRSLFRTVVFLAFAGATASTAAAQHPRLLKRHGIVYGVRGIADEKNCRYLEHEEINDGCRVYTLFGTIVSVSLTPDTRRIEGFMLRMANGRRKYQNFDPDYFPVAAEPLIRRGRRVRVSGTMAGQGQVAAPDEIITEGHR
jgi:hypothetical protein